jgi:hypothetical protein
MSKYLEHYKEAIGKQLLEKDITVKYLTMRLDREEDAEMKKKIQVMVDKAIHDKDDVQQLHDFVNNDYKS